MDVFIRGGTRAEAAGDGRTFGPREPLAFHRRLPGYAPTPLVDAGELADRVGVGGLWVKDEASRLSLPAFKILGASWAIYRLLQAELGRPLDDWRSIDELRTAVEALGRRTLVTATDGNHGRAMARMARMLGLGARVFVPHGTAEERIEAIRSEGAEASVVDGDYDAAQAAAAAWAGQDGGGWSTGGVGGLLVSDTAWPGNEVVPGWIIEGYSTIFNEADEQLRQLGAPAPNVVVVQAGVGAFLAAAIRHYRGVPDDRGPADATQPRSTTPRSTRPRSTPRIVCVEPAGAACILASLRADRIVTVPGPHRSIMAGLNCGTPSTLAWPLIRESVDIAVAIEDAATERAMRLLAEIGVVAGESGAAGLAGLAELGAVGLIDRDVTALVVNSEGATDPIGYARVMNASPAGRNDQA